ncbi:hypothetical protein AZE42_03321 [Rhizopogon vesiculosus]|uniref:Uncharacterized protein n=1 Tax=Rhizopogon vesiculosus TaxID=180088 RepID=A0A1J8QWS9_9AGAM|nr:hypothetical protein AZE42_03321 [Rhizopogon vesiculosus]
MLEVFGEKLTIYHSSFFPSKTGFNDHSFIAEDKLLIVTQRGIEIYSITDKSKPPQCTARLSLPSLMRGFEYDVVSTSINPSPCSIFQKSPYQSSCFFHPSLDDQLVIFHIRVLDVDVNEIRFFSYARLSAILQLESLCAKTYGKATLDDLSLPWSVWGPQHTSWFPGECWQQSLYGFRTVGAINQNFSTYWPVPPPRSLWIRDFNPHIACNYDADDATTRRGRLVQGIQAPTTIPHPFTEPLGSALPYREIVSEEVFDVSETCKALKAVIDNSGMLQYIIDLRYFRMIHVPGTHCETDVVPVSMHHRQLKQHEDAWQYFEYKQKCTLQPASTIHVVGGMYGSVRENAIHFAPLSSLSDSDAVHSWSHPVDTVPWLAFTFCPAQDLFIVVTLPANNESHVFDIHLRSLTTNETHPGATRSVLKAFDNVASIIGGFLDPKPEKLQINGNYISLQGRDPVFDNDLGHVQIWDWKCRKGYQFILPFTHNGCNDYSFIAEDKLLIVTQEIIEIYSITDKSKPPQCTARLSLPSLMRDWEYEVASASINPSPGPIFQKFPHLCFFHPSLDDQLVIFHIRVSDINLEGMRFFFYARLSAILQLENLYAKTCGKTIPDYLCLPWSVWGPQHTSWFPGECWQQSLYGFRTVGAIYQNPSDYWSLPLPHRLYIRDFNPHIACNDGADDATGRRGRLVQGIQTPTTIPHPFSEPLGSALPYREIVSEEVFNVLEVIMDQSILLLKASRNLCLSLVPLLTLNYDREAIIVQD